MFHGADDHIVPIAQGEASRDAWVQRDGCDPNPATQQLPDGTFERYVGCAPGVEVDWRTYQGQGHAWPSGAQSEDLKERAWALLQASAMPGTA
jgi:poly(3-hydroxybutyrate) depolymerase